MDKSLSEICQLMKAVFINKLLWHVPTLLISCTCFLNFAGFIYALKISVFTHVFTQHIASFHFLLQKPHSLE